MVLKHCEFANGLSITISSKYTSPLFAKLKISLYQNDLKILILGMILQAVTLIRYIQSNTPSFFIVWRQSFSPRCFIKHPGRNLDFHVETFFSAFPSRSSRHYRKKSERIKPNIIYLKSLENPNSWPRALRSPCLFA